MFRTPTSAPRSLRTSVLANVRGRSQHRRMRRLRLALLGSTLLVGVAIGGGLALALSRHPSLSHAKPPADTIRASLRRVGPQAELVVHGMPEPPLGETYELWLLQANGVPRATDALFTVTSNGSATVEVPGGLRGGVKAVAITREPRGGTAAPTSPAVLSVRAPTAG